MSDGGITAAGSVALSEGSAVVLIPYESSPTASIHCGGVMNESVCWDAACWHRSSADLSFRSHLQSLLPSGVLLRSMFAVGVVCGVVVSVQTLSNSGHWKWEFFRPLVGFCALALLFVIAALTSYIISKRPQSICVTKNQVSIGGRNPLTVSEGCIIRKSAKVLLLELRCESDKLTIQVTSDDLLSRIRDFIPVRPTHES